MQASRPDPQKKEVMIKTERFKKSTVCNRAAAPQLPCVSGEVLSSCTTREAIAKTGVMSFLNGTGLNLGLVVACWWLVGNTSNDATDTAGGVWL